MSELEGTSKSHLVQLNGAMNREMMSWLSCEGKWAFMPSVHVIFSHPPSSVVVGSHPMAPTPKGFSWLNYLGLCCLFFSSCSQKLQAG